MKIKLLVVLCSLVLLVAFRDNPTPLEPGGEASDGVLALRNPDEFAWQLFFYLNRQALPGVAGTADPNKQFGQYDPGSSVVWETWALASGGPASEVYGPKGEAPVAWDNLDRSHRKLILDRNLERGMVVSESQTAKLSTFVFPRSADDQEVRMNREAFSFIAQNTMYNRDGLEALLDTAVKTNNRNVILFRPGAKEVKAVWLPIEESQKNRYLWRTGTSHADGKEHIYGLVSLHIITKDLPNWFWADFGHVDCEVKENACSQQPEVALTPPVDATTRDKPSGTGSGPHGTGGVRNETVGTVWANYILRGTQTAFVTPTGSPTILSNPVIEATFQHSSCITCHARAAVGKRLVSPDGILLDKINRLSGGDPEVGIPISALYGDSSAYTQPSPITYLQTDFLWSPVTRAQRRK